MSASLDEASTGFLLDAPFSLSTNFYLLLGDNAYGYSGTSADYDTYRLHVDYGSSYSVISADISVDTDFAILDRYGNTLYLSTDYGNYSGITFTSNDTLYYIVTFSSASGFYGLRATNNSVTELNGIGETINAGQVYAAAIDYTSDSDHYYFNAVAGKTYVIATTTSMSDLFFVVADATTGERQGFASSGGGVYTITASYTGTFDLAFSSNSFYTTGSYAFVADELNVAPVIISNGGGDTASISLIENTTTVSTIIGTDSNNNGALTYSIIGGSDAAKFQINSSSGQLTFTASPDYETPTDVGGNNVYELIVQVSDGTLSDTQSINVTVVDEVHEGTSGDDTFVANTESEVFNGRLGRDTVSYINSATGVIVSLAYPAVNTSFAEGDTYTSIENVTGSNFADQIIGDVADNLLLGNSGDDTLDGAAGFDTLIGGLDNDIYVTDGGDTLTEEVGEGTDTVLSSVTHTLGSNLENLTLTGSAAINGTGNSLANRLTGNSAANSLSGGAGADTLLGGSGADKLTGGTGKDVLTGGSGVDQFIFRSTSESSASAASADIITDFIRGTDKINLSAIDAFASTATNNAFIWRGTSSFSSTTAGEVRYQKYDNTGTSNDYTMVFIDNDADTSVEMSIRVNGLHNFTSSDFIL